MSATGHVTAGLINCLIYYQKHALVLNMRAEDNTTAVYRVAQKVSHYQIIKKSY